ncbi:MAG: ribulose-phosphate 3-epimerase [Sedimentisphaerales bacterium]|nr:ribulose-phosphate 3-epimerase [Sedimentisphaerales bacterium]
MRLPKTGTIEIAPSILASDFAKLGQEIAEVEAAGAKILHLDVMDGHFVPNLTIGPPLVNSIRKTTKMVFDAHLMISEPEKYIESFVKAGVDNITFHIEVTDDPIAIVDKLHDMDCSAGICLNPETPVEAIEPVIKYFDMVLVMTVHPGFGGQKFIPEAAKKIRKIRKIAGPDIRVEVDGGIDKNTAPTVVSYGADTLVAGNAIFGQSDRKAAIDAILHAIKTTL